MEWNAIKGELCAWLVLEGRESRNGGGGGGVKSGNKYIGEGES